LRIALRDCCPRCGAKTLYASILKFSPACSECGLSFEAHDSGDGPAFFAITLLGFLVVGAAIYVDMTFRPAYWIHLFIWPPLMVVLTPLSLRFFKSYLIGWQYRTHLLEQDKS